MLHPQAIQFANVLAAEILEQIAAHQLVAERDKNSFFNLLAAGGNAIRAGAARSRFKAHQAIDFYSFGDRKVHRLGRLPFRLSRYLGLGTLHVDRAGRWALVSVTDQWESDIKVADGFR